MTTLIEKSILNERLEKSRSGTYADTSENRRKHRVGQKYGSEKKEEEKPEKTDPNKMSPEQQLEAINKVIAAVNEGKLKLPPEEINTLVAKKTMAEEAVKQAKGEKKPEKKEEPKKEATKPEAKSEGKQYASMDIKEAKKELVGKKITFKEYFFDGVDSYKDAEGEIKKVRLYGKEKQPIAEIDFPNGDGITISLEQLDKRKAMQYEIEFNDSKSEEPKQEASGQASETDKEDLRAAREKLGYLQDNEERLIKRDGKEKYDERLKQAKDEVAKLKGEKPKEENKPEPKKEEVNNLQRRKELSEKVERLISEKKKKFPNPDIESPMSDEEKRLTKEIADTWSEINKLIQENRKSKEESKSEPKQGETEESYTRVKFEDVPNSGKVNLKKYLSEKVRKGVDEKWSNIKNIPTDNLKKMEKGLVNDLNKNFEAIKKSQRAELLYSIMKVKGELESRGKETSKEGSKESGKLSDLQSKVPGYMNMPEYKKYISVKSEVDNFGKVPSGGDKRQRYDELNEQLVEATKKYKEALKKKLTT